MRIQFQSEGGVVGYIPGLSEPVTVDTRQLPADQAAAVEGLVRGARFFEQSAQQPAPEKARDTPRYTITVDDGGRRHTIRVDEPVGDADLQQLVQYLRSQARARRAAGGGPPS